VPPLPRDRTAYEILGLARSALTSQIRGRYRQLARRSHHDLPVETLLQDPAFRQVVRAYVVLTSPGRKDYDYELRIARGAPVSLPDPLAKMSRGDYLLLAAETAMLRRQYEQALQLGKEATGLEPRRGRGWALLGDLMVQRRKWDDAISMYNYAIQMEPENQRYWQSLNDTTTLKSGQDLPRRREEIAADNPSVRVWLGLLLVFLFIELSLFWVQQHPGIPLVFGIPSRWLVVAVLDGLFLGLVLASGDLIGRFEDELVYYTVPAIGPGDLGRIPIGVYAALPGLICFWIAVAFYALTAWLDDYLSYSVVAVLVCSALILAALAALKVAPLLPVMVLGGNFVLAGMLFGWLLGSVRIFPWRRGD